MCVTFPFQETHDHAHEKVDLTVRIVYFIYLIPYTVFLTNSLRSCEKLNLLVFFSRQMFFRIVMYSYFYIT